MIAIFFVFLSDKTDGEVSGHYAMESVADPFPAFASTTSVPPSCVRQVRAFMSSSDKLLDLGAACWHNSTPQRFKLVTLVVSQRFYFYTSLEMETEEGCEIDLRENREDGYASMPANYWHINLCNRKTQ
jgi:hypothetical protein